MYVDGTKLTKDTDYTVEEGSTVITLKASYLQTLNVGSHTIQIESNTGSPTANFTIKRAGGSTGGGSSYEYYTIIATVEGNGSISPSGRVKVREGRDKTFTITPDKGYAVAKVLVDGKNVGAVKSYTFEDVSKKHTIEAIFLLCLVC